MTKRQILALSLVISLLLLLLFELFFRPYAFYGSLGKELYKRSKYGKAKEMFKKMPKEDDAIAFSNIAKSSYKEEDYEEAENYSDQALSLADDDASSLYDSGNIAYQKGNYKEAIKRYEKALKLNPEDEDTRDNLELALKKLAENPPASDDGEEEEERQKKDKDEEDEKREQDEFRKVLDALDNIETKQRNRKQEPNSRTERWW